MKSEFDSTLKESFPSKITVKCWVAKFIMGCMSIEDEPLSGHLIEATTLEIIEKITESC